MRPELAYNTSSLTCTATVSDAVGTSSDLSFRWRNEAAATELGRSSSVVLDPSVASPNDRVCCDVAASGGLDTSACVVLRNRPPGGFGEPTISPERPDAAANLACAVPSAPTDDDGDVVTMAISWDRTDPAVPPEVVAGAVVTANRTAGGETWRCTAVAQDPWGGSAQRSASVVVLPAAGDAIVDERLGTLRYVPAGKFSMGCVVGRDADSTCGSEESPSREVTLTRAFWMMESELTQGQWAGLGLAVDPSHFAPGGAGSAYNPGSVRHPVETVNGWEALAVANLASRAAGLPECYALTGCTSDPIGADRKCADVAVTAASGHPKDCTGWRLPTEAEWEYAARAGTTQRYAGSSVPGDVAWYSGNNGAVDTGTYGTKAVCTAPVPRNPWGLCDLSGNVWEWTWDRYAPDYSSATSEDPVGPPTGSTRVYRGGGWNVPDSRVRTVNRSGNTLGSLGRNLGFRLVRSAP